MANTRTLAWDDKALDIVRAAVDTHDRNAIRTPIYASD